MIIVQSAPLCSFHNFMFFKSDLNAILFLIRKSLKNFERNTILFQKNFVKTYSSTIPGEILIMT